MNRSRKLVLQKLAGQIASLPLVSLGLRGLMRISPVRTIIAHRLPVTKEFEFSLAGKTIRYQSSYFDGVGRILYWIGADRYERETMIVFGDIIAGVHTFVDIGANTGFFTLVAAKINPSVSVHAFEPVPAIFQILKRHVELNGLSGNCRLNSLAVSDRVGSVPFHIPYETMASASLNPEGFCHLPGQIVNARSITLDEYVNKASLKKVDLLKIDVEGFEPQVLAGATEVLRRDRPTIICECLPTADTASIENLLLPLGYFFFHLADSGPIKRERIVPDKTGRYQNYLFTVQTDLFLD